LVDYFSIHDGDSYVSYLKRNAGQANAFGEISPAYALLPAAAFAEMDELLPGARFIFIMRDPIDRLWSSVRFRADRARRPRHLKADRAKGRRRPPNDLNADFRDILSRPTAIALSNYQHTIRELESVIPKERILYLFMETMTSRDTGPAEIRRIEAALGLEPAEIGPDILSDAVNASSAATLSPENLAAAMDVFAPVYAFIEQRFGKPLQWRSLKEMS